MTERPAPLLSVEMDRAVLAAVRRDPALTVALNAVLLRATGRLCRLMGDEEREVRIAARREGLLVEAILRPPDICVVTRVRRGPERADESPPQITV
jgi:hypothetical protein